MPVMDIPIGEPKENLNIVLPEKIQDVIHFIKEILIQIRYIDHARLPLVAQDIFAHIQVHDISGAGNFHSVKPLIDRFVELCLYALFGQIRKIRKRDEATQATIRVVFQKIVVFRQKCCISSFHNRTPLHISADVIRQICRRNSGLCISGCRQVQHQSAAQR